MRWKRAAATFGSVVATGSDGGIDASISTSPCMRKKSGSALWNTATLTSLASSSSSSGNSPMIRSAPTMLTGGRSSVTRATRPSIVQRTPLDSPMTSPSVGEPAQVRPRPIFS